MVAEKAGIPLLEDVGKAVKGTVKATGKVVKGTVEGTEKVVGGTVEGTEKAIKGVGGSVVHFIDEVIAPVELDLPTALPATVSQAITREARPATRAATRMKPSPMR